MQADLSRVVRTTWSMWSIMGGGERQDAPAPPVLQLLGCGAARRVRAARAAGGAGARSAARRTRALARARAAVVGRAWRRGARARRARAVLLDAIVALSAGHADALARQRGAAP